MNKAKAKIYIRKFKRIKDDLDLINEKDIERYGDAVIALVGAKSYMKILIETIGNATGANDE